MKRIPSLGIAFAVAVLMGSGLDLRAQSGSITVDVPFQFSVGKRSEAPGTYRFRLMHDQYLLSVLNVGTRNLEIFEAHPRIEPALEEDGRIVFRKSERCRVLHEIHFPGTDVFTELNPVAQCWKDRGKGSSTENSLAVAQR